MWLVILVMATCFASGEAVGLLKATFVPFVTGNLSQNFPFQNKCIEDLGCFYNGPPFYDPIYRPISVLPNSTLTTRFLLFTISNPQTANVLTLTQKSLAAAEIYPEFPTKIIIHGFNANLDPDDVRFQIKDALLKNGSYNVIVVDWTQLNRSPYPQAVANARAVGAQIAKLVKILMKNNGVNIKDVHIIGHSLGAHIAGWAGERLPNLSRISGLDPAGPYFYNAPPIARLDRTDANFVDIIHTNGANTFIDGLGLKQAIGHLDFYPNGGSHQPNCLPNYQLNGDLIRDLETLIDSSCDHSRAYLLFKDSINTCSFLSVQCLSYSLFQAGTCTEENSRTSNMGLYAEQLPGVSADNDKFYLHTTGTTPFCVVETRTTLSDLLKN